MPQNFLACDREQELLLPPSLREWLPRDHLAWLLSMPSGSSIWPRFVPFIAPTGTGGRRVIRR
jgi:hypothetical protein